MKIENWKLKITKRRFFALLLFLFALGAGLVYWQTAFGVTRTWDGGGADANWNTAANWSADTVPTSADIANFDGTCVSNCSPTVNVAINVAGINMAADYTGTITQSTTNTITVGASHWVQAAGTFTGGSGTIDINGTFTLSGGTFTSTSGTLEIGRTAVAETIITVSSGTFNHNNGTLTLVPTLTGGSPGTYTVEVATSLSVYNVNLSSGSDNATITPGTGDTITVLNDFTHTGGLLGGTWEVQGDVIIGSGADGGDGTLTYTTTGAHTYAYTASGIGPHLRVNHASATVSAEAGTTALSLDYFSLLAGTFTAPSGNFTIGRTINSLISHTFFSVSGGTFSHNNGTIIFDPLCGNCGSVQTYTVDINTSQTFYNVQVNNAAGGDIITTGSGDTVVVANNFTHTDGLLAGTWEVQGNYTVATTADGGTAGITFTGGNSQTYTDSGGNEVDGDVLVNKSAGTVTLASNADWNAASQDVTITSGTLASSTFNITTVNFTVNGGIFTGGSGTVTTSGPMVVSSGTFTGGSNTIDVNNTFTLSGGTFTSTSGTLEVGRGSTETIFNVSAGPTFNHNSGTMKFVGASSSINQDATINVDTTITLYNVVIGNSGDDDDIIVAAGDTIVIANDFTYTDNELESGAWDVQGNIIIGSAAEGGAGTLTMTGTGSKTYTVTTGGTGPHLRINSASLTVTANAGTTDLKVTLFSLLAGTFVAPSGTLETGRNNTETIFSISSGTTFTHNNGTVKFVGGSANTTTETIDVPTSLTLYNVTIGNSGDSSDTIALNTGDTIFVTNNFVHSDCIISNSGTWEVQGNYTVATTAEGGTAGITFTGGNNQIYTDQGGDEVNGDVTINKTPGSSVTLAGNADWNATNQDLTITSGELNMGASYNLTTTTLTVSTDGHFSNYGTGDLTLAGTLTNSGNIRFRSNGTCGGTDDILIRSSVGATQRSWNGTGVFLLHDVDVQDMAGTAALTLYSSTNTGNNGANWTFSGAACPSQPAAGISTGKINVTTGKLNLR